MLLILAVGDILQGKTLNCSQNRELDSPLSTHYSCRKALTGLARAALMV
jgi:hypothetical protein